MTDEEEIRSFLGDVVITAFPTLLTEPSEISTTENVDEIRRFLNNG